MSKFEVHYVIAMMKITDSHMKIREFECVIQLFTQKTISIF